MCTEGLLDYDFHAVSSCCTPLQTIRAAIFGVGAPEALLVGVVALVVFGPKGLAQVLHFSSHPFRASSKERNWDICLVEPPCSQCNIGLHP